MADDDKISRAISASAAILTFGENSEGRLREKLRKKGFDDESIDGAFVKLRKLKLLDDGRLVCANAEYLANQRLYGKSRVRIELIKRGFDRRLIDEKLDECLCDVDFKENCYKLVHRKRLEGKILNPDTAKNVSASLVRYGYGYSEIKYAYIRILKENEE